MITAIEQGISKAIYEVFGDGYEIHIDECEQGFTKPAFWILETSAQQELVFGKRYNRKYNFDVQYFPKADGYERTEEINTVTDALLMALEIISVNSGLIRGSGINYSVQDGVLHFFITYEVFVLRPDEDVPMMETLTQTQHVKGANDG